MAKSFFIIVILCVINISITISYNINDRLSYQTNVEEPEVVLNNTIDSSFSYPDIDHCVPVRAVRELGCTLSEKNPLFKELFRSTCEQHQLCYACGFAHSITARQCNILALMSMYEQCSLNNELPFSSCLKQRFPAIILLRQQNYRSVSYNPAFLFECQHQCVFDYLHAK